MASIFRDLLDILGIIENLPDQNEMLKLIKEWVNLFTGMYVSGRVEALDSTTETFTLKNGRLADSPGSSTPINHDITVHYKNANVTGVLVDGVTVQIDTKTSVSANDNTIVANGVEVYTGNASNAVESALDAITALRAELKAMKDPPDQAQELAMVEKACRKPLVGLGLVLAALPGALLRHSTHLWELFFADEDDFDNWEPLEAPGTTYSRRRDGATRKRKYLIFSDVHRDAASDDVNATLGNELKPGSIDHYKRNAKLYEKILEWAWGEDYTILEAGDCEELWFVRDVDALPHEGSLNMVERLREIIKDHKGVYTRLAQLHKNNEYFRIQGNHDSFVRTDEYVFLLLKEEMEELNTTGDPEFKVYDACVIPGVKTMMEHSAFNALEDVVDCLKKNITKAELGRRLIQGRVGLDSKDYSKKTAMIVAHGHQFDFWNSEHNQILGLLISNTAVTFIDKRMDPFLDARGIALQGNPLIDFGDVFASLPVFDSFPSRSAAVRFAHRIQHMPNYKRTLNDSVMYSETLPALWAAFGIALNKDGVTPAASRQNWTNTPSYDDIKAYLEDHHFNHVCLGHTHNPQSQPHLTLKNIGALLPPGFELLFSITSALIPDLIEPKLKTTYFNSGTVGWMEGVAWAIEIDEEGQARLVYWTDNDKLNKPGEYQVYGPEYMDWELQELDVNVKTNLSEQLADVFVALDDEADELLKKLMDWLKKFNISSDAEMASMAQQAVLPIQALAIALMETSEPSRIDRQLYDAAKKIMDKTEQVVEEAEAFVGKVATQSLEEAKKIIRSLSETKQKVADHVLEALETEYEELQSFTRDVFLMVKRRTLKGFNEGESDELKISAAISKDAYDSLQRFRAIFRMLNKNDREAQHYAGIAHAILDGFPRNLPFFSSVAEPLDPASRLLSSDAPALQALLSTLQMYLPDGLQMEHDESDTSAVAVGERVLTNTGHIYNYTGAGIDAPSDLRGSTQNYKNNPEWQKLEKPPGVVGGKHDVAIRARFSIQKHQVVLKVRLWQPDSTKDFYGDPQPQPELEPSGNYS